jgi:nucleoid DNA-binding protein
MVNKQRYYSKELVESVAKKIGMEADAVRIITNAYLEEIESMLKKHREVDLMNFGKFYLTLYRGQGYDVTKKEKIKVQVQRVNFQPSRRLKDDLNGRKKNIST